MPLPLSSHHCLVSTSFLPLHSLLRLSELTAHPHPHSQPHPHPGAPAACGPSVFRGLWNHISKASISPKALESGDCWPAWDPLLPLRQQQPQWLGGGGCYGGMLPQKAAPQEGGDTLPSGAASEVEEDSLIFYSSSSRDLYLYGTVGLK